MNNHSVSLPCQMVFRTECHDFASGGDADVATISRMGLLFVWVDVVLVTIDATSNWMTSVHLFAITRGIAAGTVELV